MIEKEDLVKVTETEKIMRISFEGEMTIYTASQIKEELLEKKEAFETDKDNVELDVSKVYEFDTSGMQLLMMTKIKFVSFAKTVRITGHSKSVSDAIGLYKLNNQLDSQNENSTETIDDLEEREYA